MLIKLKNHQKGDTIVEVLLSMAIIAMVLGLSYSLATRALRTGRQAQERIEALKLVESQIEKIKYLSQQSGFAWPAGPYCVTSANAVSSTAITGFSTNIDTDNFAGYAAAGCQVNSQYNLSIRYDSANNDTFTFMARWDRLGGGRDETVIYYRLRR